LTLFKFYYDFIIKEFIFSFIKFFLILYLILFIFYRKVIYNQPEGHRNRSPRFILDVQAAFGGKHRMTKLCLPLLFIFLCSCQAVKEESSSFRPPDAETRKAVQAETQPVKQPKWMRVVERGDRAAKEKRWGKAAKFYNHALDLMDEPIATPQAPSPAQIKKVLRRASHAQLLAENSREQGTRSILECSTMMRSKVRGLKIIRYLIPIQFEFGKTIFSEKGQESARQLAYCLQHSEDLNEVKLIGHTDEKGSDAQNDKLSVARANALKKYLQEKGVKLYIFIDGRGEKEPLALDNPDDYTQAEIDALNRRVEVITQ
jgi:outer membrane protein OmpA-like peptidoglycan-associated protein